VRDAYGAWQKNIRLHQAALNAQATRKQRIETLELQLEELEAPVQTDYKEIEQEFDRLSHHEHIMQDCSSSLAALDDAEQNINQEISSILRRLVMPSRILIRKFPPFCGALRRMPAAAGSFPKFTPRC